MSRDKRLNRTQEVDGSSPFSSTSFIKNLARPSRSRFSFGHTFRNRCHELACSAGLREPGRSYFDQGGTTPLVRAYAIDCPRCSC
jgi:hypothetical protein